MNITIAKITESSAMANARNYRNAKVRFQVSIAWAVGQTLSGNADGMQRIMEAAELLSKEEGKMAATADGRQVWKYVTASQEDGGVGLGKVIQWSKEKDRFIMAPNWKDAAADLDMKVLIETLSETRWDQFQRMPASRAFDLDKSIMALVSRASKAGKSEMDVRNAFLRLAA